MATTIERLEVSEENAPKFLDWIANRGGLAVWRSQDLGNLGASWTTPATSADGSAPSKPHWAAALSHIVTSADDVDVTTYREVKRFHVAVMNGGLFRFVLTDGSQRKLEKALEKAGEGATYHFDYETQDALIMVPDSVVKLSQWQGR